MKNLGNMLKQAQQMQAKMQEMQAELEAREVQGAAGGGMVNVTLNGKSELKSIRIDPALMKEDEREVLEDLIKAAHADAKARVEREMAEQMQKLTAGMPLPPGMKLPF
ncbi:YbaB/EbfC family nucleoid-associated protein [Ferrovibrio sp.]|uniref:YbaB/EbfC family nucleoid-associated protein n=1 Tax=Ferrovibrio sp. TaxID=1917215 RepID=UPI000CBB80AD|nr:YbaB/EbfC family nucleoid-associated protein [Ferrovibrio sp.]PJI41064.1 MAG: YbaB/EbfC family nucleoid-associated protein [Ferrovibrio sp.]